MRSVFLSQNGSQVNVFKFSNIFNVFSEGEFNKTIVKLKTMLLQT